jgi:chorismate-pyruvate lyase
VDFLALGGSAASSVVFGILAGEGGKGHVRNLLLAAGCAGVPATVAIVRQYRARRRLRGEVEARQRALERQREIEAQAANVQIEAEARLIVALRSRLSPILYYLGKIADPLGKIAAASSDTQAAESGRLTQAVVSAAIEHRDSRVSRRSVFFKLTGPSRMTCVSYAGYEGRQDASRTVFTDSGDDPVGQYMFQLLERREAALIPDVDAPEAPAKFPGRRSYESVIAAAVSAGDTPYGILILDASAAGALDNPDLETIKTLASLLGIGLALVSPPGTG